MQSVKYNLAIISVQPIKSIITRTNGSFDQQMSLSGQLFSVLITGLHITTYECTSTSRPLYWYMSGSKEGVWGVGSNQEPTYPFLKCLYVSKPRHTSGTTYTQKEVGLNSFGKRGRGEGVEDRSASKFH